MPAPVTSVTATPTSSSSIARVAASSLSAEVFDRDFVRPMRPVILTGAMTGWNAMTAWSLDGLRATVGDTRVQTRNYRENLGVHRRDWRAFVQLEEMVLRDYLDLLERGDARGLYLGQLSLAHTFPSLVADVVPPAFVTVPTHDVVWMGYGGHVEPLHFDLPHGLIAAVRGRKRFVIYRPEDQQYLYPFPFWSQVPVWFSQVDPAAPAPAHQPKAARATALEFVLEPGEMLFSPSGWWHQTVCLDPVCVSVTHFFQFSARDHLWKARKHPWHLGFMGRVYLQAGVRALRGLRGARP